MSTTMMAALMAVLAAAQDATIQPISACTKTHTPTSFSGCDTIAGVTLTSYTDCGGCALATETSPRCKRYPATDFDLTTTETTCAPSTTQGFETQVKRQDEDGTISVPATCFTYVTTTTNSFGGDCTPLPTTTVGVDCGGCGLVTITETKEFGDGACPTETAKTSMVCAPSPAKL